MKTLMSCILSSCLWLTYSSISYAQTDLKEIEDRQQAFEAIEDQTDFIEDALEEDQIAWPEITQRSEALTSHAKSLSQLFSEGNNDEGRAKSAVWDNPKKFNQFMLQLNNGLAALEKASKKQALAPAQAGLEQAQDSCKSCHMKYRSLW